MEKHKKSILHRFARDESAAAGMMIVIGASAMIGCAAIAVDMGTLYLAKRQLQGLADAAVIAAVESIEDDGEAEARLLLDKNGADDVVIAEYTRGIYSADPDIAPENRFAATVANPSAAHLTLTRQQPLFFAKLLVGRATSTVAVEAVAARKDKAAFAIGSRLGTLSGGLPNQILSAIAGNDLQLTVTDIGNLQTTSIELLAFADALRVQTGMTNVTYGELFESEVPVSSVVLAMADTADPASASMLRDLAARVGSETLVLADMIDLGPLARTDVNDGQTHIGIDALSLLRASLIAASGAEFAADVSLSLPGISETRLLLAGGDEIAQSPFMTVTDDEDVRISTSRMRLYVETKIASSLLGSSTLKVPFYVDAASASARLSSIECSTGGSGATLAVTPSLGTAALAEIDPALIDEFTTPVSLKNATLANVLGTKVTAFAEAEIGGAHEQSVAFSADDIAAHAWKSVHADDITSALATFLLGESEITVTAPLGLSLSTAPTGSAIADAVGTVTPQVDALINDVAALMGVRLGVADVTVNRLRCGTSTLVS